MRSFIFKLYYADKITQEIALQLLEKLEQSKQKSRRY